MLYLAYGSNMSSPRLFARIPGARTIGRARVPGYQLHFHKVGYGDDSGKCDALATGDQQDELYGVVYEVSDKDIGTLDRIEGVGHGYRRVQVAVYLDGNEKQTASTYIATHTDADIMPLQWYKEHVLRGAREHKLPAAYIADIEAVRAIPDRDPARDQREREIYQ